MSEEFDRFLGFSLAPPDRLPDRRFVAGVQERIIVEEGLARERRALVGNLITQLIALSAVAGALWVCGQAAPVAEWFARSGEVGVAILVVAFTFVVAVLSRSGRPALRTQAIG